MTRREFAILQAVNIATAKHRRPGHGFEATAAEIAETLNNDHHLAEYGVKANTRSLGASLWRMSQGEPVRPAPLVERFDARRWRLTKAGLAVLVA